MSSAVPALKPARVTLTLNDGQQITCACDSPRRDCLNPYDESEIRLKYRQLAGLALTPQGVGGRIPRGNGQKAGDPFTRPAACEVLRQSSAEMPWRHRRDPPANSRPPLSDANHHQKRYASLLSAVSQANQQPPPSSAGQRRNEPVRL
jgi:hypothetical protein